MMQDYLDEIQDSTLKAKTCLEYMLDYFGNSDESQNLRAIAFNYLSFERLLGISLDYLMKILETYQQAEKSLESNDSGKVQHGNG